MQAGLVNEVLFGGGEAGCLFVCLGWEMFCFKMWCCAEEKAVFGLWQTSKGGYIHDMSHINLHRRQAVIFPAPHA